MEGNCVDYTGTRTVSDAASLSPEAKQYILRVYVDNALMLSEQKKVAVGCTRDSWLSTFGLKSDGKIRQADPEGSRAAIRAEAANIPKKVVCKLNKAPGGVSLDGDGIVQTAFDIITESTKGKKFDGKTIVALWIDTGESFVVFATNTTDDGNSCALSVD